MTNTQPTILRIDASARRSGSTTRTLSDELIKELNPGAVTVRDLADGLPFIDEEWVGANFTSAETRTEAQKAKLQLSDQLIDELFKANTIILGVPTYNFGIPASLKAWVDLIARARLTFRYTDNGPEGLLTGKKAYIVFASGGTPVSSGYDFATSYLKHVLAFVGITDINIIAADQSGSRGDEALTAARQQISDLAASAA